VALDDPLNEEFHAEWKVIANNLKAQNSVRRCYFQTTITQPFAHCFADANLRAYAVVVFIIQ